MRRPTSAKAALLRQLPGLDQINRHEMEEIERALDDVDLRAGTVLIRGGSVVRQAFIVFDAQGVHLVGFDEMSEGRVASATVVADRPARALVAGPASFPSLMRSRSFASAISATEPNPMRRPAMAVVPA